MEKLFFSFFVLLFLVSNNNINAQQSTDEEIEVTVTNESEQCVVSIQNNLEETLHLKSKAFGISFESESSKELIAQTNVRNAVKIVLDFEQALRPIIHQDELFVALTPIIHQDELFLSPIIHQDELFAALTPIIHQDELFLSPIIHQDELFGFFKLVRLLSKKTELLYALRTILEQEGGQTLIIEMFTEKNFLKKNNASVNASETTSFNFTMSEPYDMVQIKTNINNKFKKKDVLFFPQTAQ